MRAFGARAQTRGNDGEPGTLPHVACVQPAAIVLECGDELVEAVPDGHTGRDQRGLNLTEPIDQDLQIVEPPQSILGASERAQIGAGALTGRLGGHFDRIAQLLQRDTNAMQPLGQIDGAGIAHRRGEVRGSRRYSCVDRPAPCLRGDLAGSLVFWIRQAIENPGEAAGRAPRLVERQRRRQMAARVVARFRDRDRGASKCLGVLAARNAELINQQHEHVEFPDRAKSPGHLAQAPAELSRDVRVELKQRNQFAQTPARHASLVKRAHVPFRCTIDGGCKTVEMLTEQLQAVNTHRLLIGGPDRFII